MDGEFIVPATEMALLGISVLPIGPDKRPVIAEWKTLQSTIAEPEQIYKYWANGASIGAICGRVSGNLECIDFDVPDDSRKSPVWPDYRNLCEEHGYADLLRKLIIIRTPSGGIHLIYRHSGHPEGNRKLANTSTNDVLIETRGEGGYIATSPTHGYKVLHGSWSSIPMIDAEEREFLLNAARVFDQGVQQRINYERHCQDHKPGEMYNISGPHLLELFEAEGWVRAGHTSRGTLVRRPGKKTSWSGTISEDGRWFYCFTSSTEFEPNRGYSKFSCLTIMKHGGRYDECARELASQGYKSSRPEMQSARYESGRSLPSPADIMPLSSHEPEDPVWLGGWPYIRIGHLNLLEAKGSTGKSTFTLAIACLGSIGRTPFGDECEPFRTLYIARQDSPGEVRQKVAQIAGDNVNLDYLLCWDKCPVLNHSGLRELQDTIDRLKVKWIVYDPMKSLFPPNIRADFDNLGLNKFFDDLRQVHVETNTAAQVIRHMPKIVLGRELTDMATGGSEWRDSARTQLVMLPHPDRDGHPMTTGIFPARGSMVSASGDPFGFRAFKSGMEFYSPDEFQLVEYAEHYPAVAAHYGFDEFLTDPAKSRGAGGRPSVKRLDCIEWLKGELDAGPVFQSVLVSKANSVKGYAKGTVIDALREGNFKRVEGSQATWKLL